MAARKTSASGQETKKTQTSKSSKSASVKKTSKAGTGKSTSGKASSANTSSGKTSSRKTSASKKTTSSGKAASQSSKSESKQVNIEDYRDRSGMYDEIELIAALAVCILLLLSIYDLCGTVGNYISYFVFGLFGWLAYLLPYTVFLGSAFLIANRRVRTIGRKAVAILILIVMAAAFCQMMYHPKVELVDLLGCYQESAVYKKGGGLIGGAVCGLLTPWFGTAGTYLIIIALFAVGIVLLAGRSVYRNLFGALREKAAQARIRHEERQIAMEEAREEEAIRREEERLAREEEEQRREDERRLHAGQEQERRSKIRQQQEERQRKLDETHGPQSAQEDTSLDSRIPVVTDIQSPGLSAEGEKDSRKAGQITKTGKDEIADAAKGEGTGAGDREFEAAGARSREFEAAGAGDWELEAADAGARVNEGIGAGSREDELDQIPIVRYTGEPEADSGQASYESNVHEDYEIRIPDFLNKNKKERAAHPGGRPAPEARAESGSVSTDRTGSKGKTTERTADGSASEDRAGRGLESADRAGKSAERAGSEAGAAGSMDTGYMDQDPESEASGFEEEDTFAKISATVEQAMRESGIESDAALDEIPGKDHFGEAGFRPGMDQDTGEITQRLPELTPYLKNGSADTAAAEAVGAGIDQAWAQAASERAGTDQARAQAASERAGTDQPRMQAEAAGAGIAADVEALEEDLENMSLPGRSTAAEAEPYLDDWTSTQMQALDAQFGDDGADREIRERSVEEKYSNQPPYEAGSADMPPAQAVRRAAAGSRRVSTGAAKVSGTEAVTEEEIVPVVKEYVFPPMDLLKRGKAVQITEESNREIRKTAQRLLDTLESFGVKVHVTNVSCGPSVTRYELSPEYGVKVSRILALTDDIKLNLAVTDIRIEAPIPGKAAIGIEVPNKENQTVMLRDLLESPEYKNSRAGLTFAVGRDLSGRVIVSDVAKMPHLLIAGATGSGKSVCINTLIMSIIYKSKPEDVRMIMIDPKVVELSIYNGIPHLLIPVVTDPKKAAGALNWAVSEMEKRYQKFAQLSVRDIKGYNEKVEAVGESEEFPKMPQIIIIVDELADLMMVASSEVEDAICRLAQLARAAGIHLVIATQRPSVNVITGLIKANIPSRIAFSVSSGVDSRTIIDMNGAEKLLGKGDMLFYPTGYQKPVRVQGSFVSDQEINAVVEFLKKNQETPQYVNDIEETIVSQASKKAKLEQERDVYFAEAGRLIIEKDKASIGMLQRVYRIGFNRAGRIMDQLCQAGVVGPEEGTKPRKILMTKEEFEELVKQF